MLVYDFMHLGLKSNFSFIPIFQNTKLKKSNFQEGLKPFPLPAAEPRRR